MLAPVVIVFTKHDRLVTLKILEEAEQEEDIDEETLHERGTISASKSFAASVLPLEKLMAELNIPTIPHVTVSGANFRCQYSFANV